MLASEAGCQNTLLSWYLQRQKHCIKKGHQIKSKEEILCSSTDILCLQWCDMLLELEHSENSNYKKVMSEHF